MKIESGAIVCIDAEVVGDVRIGAGMSQFVFQSSDFISGTVIHPRASVISSPKADIEGTVVDAGGPINLGGGNIIEEKAVLLTTDGRTMQIGSSNVFEVGCRIESSVIGDGNVIECRAVLGPNSVLGNGCVIGAGVVISAGTVLPDDCIVFGPTAERQIVPGTMEVCFFLSFFPSNRFRSCGDLLCLVVVLFRCFK